MRVKSACAARNGAPGGYSGAAPPSDHLSIGRRSARADDNAEKMLLFEVPFSAAARRGQSLRYPDLNPMTQAVLLSSVAILTAIVLLRVVVLFRRQHARVPHRYPGSWTNDQSKTFEQFRLLMGMFLAITWVILQMAAPRMPESWPFGLEETLLTIGLLLLTNACLLLLIPSN